MSAFKTNIFYLMLLSASAASTGCNAVRFEDKLPLASAPGAMATPRPEIPSPMPTPAPTPLPPPPPVAKTQTENFVQGNSGNQIDILIVNDNSLSMSDNQAKLASRFGSFVANLGDLDYHIGMTTTDLDSPKFNQGGKLISWQGANSITLTPQTPDASKIFQNSIVRQETLACDGTYNNCPSGNEQALMAIINALSKKSTDNAGFFRSNVPLIVVVLSNEDEKSDGSDGGAQAQNVLDAVSSSFGAGKTFVMNGIIVRPGDSSCLQKQRDLSQRSDASYYGYRVSELVSRTGGGTISICENDYAKPLAEMSLAMRRLVTTYELQSIPKSGSVKVRFSPEQKIGFQLNGKKLVLDAPPSIGTKIDVEYEVD